MADEIIEELWQIKDSMAREYGYNIDAFVAHLNSRQRLANQQIVDLRAIKEATKRAASSMPYS